MTVSLLLFALLWSTGWGLDVPRATHAFRALDVAGFSPRTTPKPFVPRGIGRRSEAGTLVGYTAPDNTCAYVDGIYGAAKSCQPGWTCAAYASTAGVLGGVGCCPPDPSRDCIFSAACVDRTDYASCAQDQGCRQDINLIKCTRSAQPWCFPYYIPGIRALLYSCDSSSPTTTATAYTTFNGETDGRSWSPLYLTSSGPGSEPSTRYRYGAPNPRTTPRSTGLTVPPSSPPSDPPTTTPSPEPASSFPIGAVVGGAVGGLAVICAAIAGIVFLCLRPRRRSRSAAADIPQPSSPAGHSYPEAVYSPRGSYFPTEQKPSQPMTDVSHLSSPSSAPRYSSYAEYGASTLTPSSPNRLATSQPAVSELHAAQPSAELADTTIPPAGAGR